MPDEQKTKLRLEIAHVLFIDIVGYSILLINQQSEVLRELNGVVIGTDQFREADAEGKLIRLPTGDGMALVFRNDPEAPAQCALEISRALKNHPNIQLRMGVHSGPVNEITDVNERANIAGAGINIAQRVMDCGDAGHILLSRHVAEDLEQYDHWQPLLHDVGECEVKHGVRVHVVNLYTDGLGNREIPQRFAKRPAVSAVTPSSHIRLRRWFIGAAIGAIVVVAALALLRLSRSKDIASVNVVRQQPQAAIAAPEKSIAVLPFQNLSDESQNAYFADGVQDEILTNLAKIADLKVISRTSVMQYKTGPARNLREIGQQLGVAHLLEGSVQRAGNRIRVNAQLIDTRTDGHLWAQTYDRDLADVFAIQSEIAKTIADQLQAKLSPKEKAEIEKPPTSNLAAFDLYTRANALLLRGTYSSELTAQMKEAGELLNQAVALDSDFFLAYLRLAYVHEQLYFLGEDHTPARRALGDAALQVAIRLRSDDGETHRAIATRLYHDLDYVRAREELQKARQTLPNSPNVFELAGYIDRREGRWEDSIRNHQKALELDPRNYFLYQQISLTYTYLRRFQETAAALDRALEIIPGDADSRVARASADLFGRADTEPLNNTIDDILSHDPAAAQSLARSWLLVAMCRRDSAEAERAVAALPSTGFVMNGVNFPRPFCQAMVARLRGDEAAAREALMQARSEIEAKLQASPEYPSALVMLGLVDAGLGNKEDAIREGRRAAELMPISKEALVGSVIIELTSVIYAWTGEKDRALEQVSLSARTPGGVTYGELKLLPYWDPLRGDPRFEKIVASLAPKE